MTDVTSPSPKSPGSARQLAIYLTRDKFALVAAAFLTLLLLCALFGPLLVGEQAAKLGLRQRNLPPFSTQQGWIYMLGADTLGRPILARLVVGAQKTLTIAAAAVLCSMIVGGTLGLVAGYSERWYSHVIQRLADVVMSFPSLLLALIVLYTLGPSMLNLIIVLAITRMPVFIRTARAEVLELRERMFVSAARSMGASSTRVLVRHIAPLALPTLVTIAAIDVATVILTESALSFLGLGIQPPDFTWGAMVANGRGYLATAWWIAFWPGLAILLTTLSLNVLSSWARTVADPQQRWRLQSLRKISR
ncbi:ABC transporter permease [Mesorhizobium sp. B2-6-4]|uniref:ABC transporter permease n=1 Tax=Mesorhizobium sp. B2-6-4 TaxID=2589913 RepID=UPI00112B69D5|nr:ABC transporter permease [Mesorhizobium sp. B2-6-4]TPJ49579.1 ABC transporter permease [Mesorhizobium sp. B2-6-4]